MDWGSAAAALPARCATATPPHLPAPSLGGSVGLELPLHLLIFVPNFLLGAREGFWGCLSCGCCPLFHGLGTHHASSLLDFKFSLFEMLLNVLFPAWNDAAFGGLLLEFFLRGGNW